MKKPPQRKQLRLKYYNYSNNGCYFITICTKDRKEILSKIKAQEMDVGAGRRTRPTRNKKINYMRWKNEIT